MKLEDDLSAESLSALVVDDDDFLAEFISLELERLGCTVRLAHNVDAALESGHEDIDMLVTDVNMPGADGFSLVRQLRAGRTAGVPLHIVMMTTRDDEATIRQAAEAGVDDFLYKPVAPIQLELAVASARRSVRIHRMLYRRNAALAEAHSQVQHTLLTLQEDLNAAAGLHKRLLPKPERLKGVRVTHVYRPASMLGGDTIGASDVGDGKTLFFLLDVQGHGVRASLDSFHLHHRLKQLRPRGPEELGKALANMNSEILRQDADTYATAVCGIVDPENEIGWLVCAGHPDPLLLEDGQVAEVNVPRAFPLGWFEDATYEPQPFPFRPGSRLFIFSDGLSDCYDRSGRQLGSEGVARLLAHCSGQPLQTIPSLIELALRLRENEPALLDDISLLALEPGIADKQAP